MKKGIFFVLMLLPLLSVAQSRQARLELVAMGGVPHIQEMLGAIKRSF